MKKIILFLFLVVFYGCGDKVNNTEVVATLDVSGLQWSSISSTNGMLFYGIRPSDGMFFSDRVAGGGLQKIIPNGNWHFYILVWDTSFTNLKCALARDVNLAGGTKSLNFVVNSTQCSGFTSEASKYISSNKFKPLKIHLCATATAAANCSTIADGWKYSVRIPTFRMAPFSLDNASTTDFIQVEQSSSNFTFEIPVGGLTLGPMPWVPVIISICLNPGASTVANCSGDLRTFKISNLNSGPLIEQIGNTNVSVGAQAKLVTSDANSTFTNLYLAYGGSGTWDLSKWDQAVWGP